MNIRKSHQIPDSSEVKYCIFVFCILYCYVGLIWIGFIRFLFGSVSSVFFSPIWIIVFIVLYVVV